MWAIEWTFGRSRPFKKFPSCCFPWPPNPFPPRRHTFHQPHTHPTPPHRVPQAAGTSKRSRQCVHKCQGGRKRREYLGPFNTPTLNQGHANVHHQKHHDNDKKKGEPPRSSLWPPSCSSRASRRRPWRSSSQPPCPPRRPWGGDRAGPVCSPWPSSARGAGAEGAAVVGEAVAVAAALAAAVGPVGGGARTTGPRPPRTRRSAWPTSTAS